jgi:hypothetical protein
MALLTALMEKITPYDPKLNMAGTGAPGRTRTCYPRLRRPMLYPDELRAQVKRIVLYVLTAWFSLPFVDIHLPAEARKKGGRGREIRTPDILLPKQARYQTALYPDAR